MKKTMKIIYLTAIVLLGSTSISWGTPSSVFSNMDLNGNHSFITDQLSVKDVLHLDFSKIEKKLGRRLQLKDRIVLRKIRKNLRKAKQEGKSNEEMKKILREKPKSQIAGASLLGVVIVAALVGLIMGPDDSY